MARIVYGVSGEGSGHATRAGVMIRHLLAQGHQVQVVTYGRGVKPLAELAPVFPVEGLTLVTAENQVSVHRTLADNLGRAVDGHRRVRALRREVFEGWRPHAVVTDFEPLTAHLAGRCGLPLVTLDNQHRLRYMEHPCPRRLRASRALTLAVIRAMIPRPDVSLVTTFTTGPVANDRTLLFPPILSADVLAARSRDGDHVLVYLTHGFDGFVKRLARFPRERFRVYGAGREGTEGNVTCCAPSREGFLADLAACKAVMATAGFTLITEALHLGKPYLALPMKGQFEQEFNAFLVGEAGYGKGCPRPRTEAVAAFLYRLPEYRARLAAYPRSDNGAVAARLGGLLAEDAAEARAFRDRRQG